MKGILKIVLGNILITSAYAFITVPNGIVNGGVTSFAMIVQNIFNIDISIITNTVTILFLLLSFFSLGKEFFAKSILSSLCYMLFFSILHSLEFSFPLNIYLSIIVASILVGVGYFLCISANSSTVGFDLLALVMYKKNPNLNVAVTIRYINFTVILLGLYSYGLISVIYGIAFTYIQTFVLKYLLKKQ